MRVSGPGEVWATWSHFPTPTFGPLSPGPSYKHCLFFGLPSVPRSAVLIFLGNEFLRIWRPLPRGGSAMVLRRLLLDCLPLPSHPNRDQGTFSACKSPESGRWMGALFLACEIG